MINSRVKICDGEYVHLLWVVRGMCRCVVGRKATFKWWSWASRRLSPTVSDFWSRHSPASPIVSAWIENGSPWQVCPSSNLHQSTMLQSTMMFDTLQASGWSGWWLLWFWRQLASVAGLSWVRCSRFGWSPRFLLLSRVTVPHRTC